MRVARFQAALAQVAGVWTARVIAAVAVAVRRASVVYVRGQGAAQGAKQGHGFTCSRASCSSQNSL